MTDVKPIVCPMLVGIDESSGRDKTVLVIELPDGKRPADYAVVSTELLREIRHILAIERWARQLAELDATCPQLKE